MQVGASDLTGGYTFLKGEHELLKRTHVALKGALRLPKRGRAGVAEGTSITVKTESRSSWRPHWPSRWHSCCRLLGNLPEEREVLQIVAPANMFVWFY